MRPSRTTLQVCFGRSAYEAHFAALLGDDAEWAALPDRPPAALRGAGRLVKLVAAGGGVVQEVRHREAIYALPSFARMHLESEEGERLLRTVDLNSCAGEAGADACCTPTPAPRVQCACTAHAPRMHRAYTAHATLARIRMSCVYCVMLIQPASHRAFP